MLDHSRFMGNYRIEKVFRSSLLIEPLLQNVTVIAEAFIGRSALLRPLDAAPWAEEVGS